MLELLTDTRIDLARSGARHGEGLFETLRVRDGAPLRLAAHLERLAAGARFLGLEPPPPLVQVQAFLAAEVVSVEIDPELARSAAARVAAAAPGRKVRVVQGDGARDWADGGPWNAILLSGSVPSEPTALLERLAPGGRLLAVVGDAPVMRACLWTRAPQGLRRTVLFETVIPEFRNAAEPERFSF